jgi:hypothetical protein
MRRKDIHRSVYEKLFLLLLMAILLAPANAQEAIPVTTEASKATVPREVRAFTIRRGTKVKVILSEEVNSGRAKRGDRVHFLTAEAVRSAEGQLLLPAGTPATGTVTDARRAGKLGRPGKITVACENLYPRGLAVVNAVIPVSSEGEKKIADVAVDHTLSVVVTSGVLGFTTAAFTQRGMTLAQFSEDIGSRKEKETTTVATLIGVTAFMGSLRRGSEAKLNQGSTFIVVVNRDTDIELTLSEAEKQ